MSYWNSNAFSDLVGNVILAVNEGQDELVLELQDGRKAKMYHCQDCCESVYHADTVGNVADILNSPVLRAVEELGDEGPDGQCCDESYTWTYFTVETANGTVTFKWFGTSNGYYSEDVSFYIES